jgi:CBS domain-containing protein
MHGTRLAAWSMPMPGGGILSWPGLPTKGKTMRMVSEVMTRNVMFVSPRESLQRAAQMMDELNVGVLPVCEGERLIGMVTDRDITVRGTAAGKAPRDAHVEDVMSADVRWCFEDQPLDEVMQQMANSQVRRVPVVSHDASHRLVGIVALGDLATRTTDAIKQEVEQVVEKVSTPSEPDRSASDAAGDDEASLAAIAPTPGTSAGPGSTKNIGAAAGTGMAAPATGAGSAAGSDTNAPARGIADAAGGPSTPGNAADSGTRT